MSIMSRLTLLLISCLMMTGTSFAGSDKTMLIKGYSYAPSLNDKATIYQTIALLERAVQQNDPELLATLFLADSSREDAKSHSSEIIDQVRERFSSAENQALCLPARAPGWSLTGFRNFRFYVDSVSVAEGQAVAYLRAGWTRIGLKSDALNKFSLNFNKVKGRWCLDSYDAILSLIKTYTETDAYYNSPKSDPARGSVSKAMVLQSTAEPLDADLLLRPVSWSTTYSIPRATWSQSRQHLDGQKLFGCVSSVSSYVYLDADDFAADLIAASDECWRRIVVADDHPDHNYITSKGHHGFGATVDEFCAPRGMEFSGPSYLYIAEDYNNRIKILLVSTQSGDHVDLFKFITMSQLNHPQDLDVMAADQYGERRVIVANTGGNNILAFTDQEPLGPNTPVVHNGVGSSVGAFSRPISIAFGRDPLTSEKSAWCYFIDSGNKRIVKIGNVFSAPTYNSYEVYDDFPDLRTDLSGIGVDNKGEVWVVDRGLGRIYKFTSGLVPIATHGMTGTADGEYLRPTSISFTEGYEYGVGPIANLGEVVLGEKWGEDTGIRRLVSGTEIFDAHLYYNPKLADGTPACLNGDYFITGYSNLTEQYIAPNGTTYTNTFNMRPSGLEPFNFTLPAGSPSGTYRVKIKAQSIYQNSNTDSMTLSINVDTSAVNQLPVVSCIYFTNGDTCFMPYIPQPIGTLAHDPDGSVANYFWSCDPVSAGDFSDPYANPTYFTAYPSLDKVHIPRIVRVQVTDDYGQYSRYRSVDIDQCPVARCVCVSCGDANSDGGIDISDAVLLISYIFLGGIAPADCSYANGMGDANGDGALDVSDAVYLISFIFTGGLTPHCQ
jgi:hypothetical protein